jgi:hypothetical protein
MPPAAALDPGAKLRFQAGLRAHERAFPDPRLPMPGHSGAVRTLDSSTVAGAAPALVETTAPASRLTLPIERREPGTRRTVAGRCGKRQAAQAVGGGEKGIHHKGTKDTKEHEGKDTVGVGAALPEALPYSRQCGYLPPPFVIASVVKQSRDGRVPALATPPALEIASSLALLAMTGVGMVGERRLR